MSTKWTPEMLALKKKEEVQLNPKYEHKAWNPADFTGWTKQQSEGVQAKPNFVVSPEMFHEQAPLNLRDDVRAIEKNGDREGQSESVINSMIAHRAGKEDFTPKRATDVLNQPWKVDAIQGDMENIISSYQGYNGGGFHRNPTPAMDLDDYVDALSQKNTESLQELYNLDENEAEVKRQMFRRLMEK